MGQFTNEDYPRLVLTCEAREQIDESEMESNCFHLFRMFGIIMNVSCVKKSYNSGYEDSLWIYVDFKHKESIELVYDFTTALPKPNQFFRIGSLILKPADKTDILQQREHAR